ncbi:MAG TPA: ATP-binding protein [Candidatus Dormibacteraeota bacterium]|nr:ATP-binding protein [Candidatus Dormibacteraeota bacterium]
MKEKALQILLVEDNAGDARLLREMFSKERPDSFELTHLLRMSDAVIHLAKGGVDIILLDMGLPDGHGLDTVRRAHAAAPGVPVIVLTGLDDEALAAEAMKEGAQDYLIKGQIENRALPRALRHAIERHRMQTETDLIRTHQMQFKDEFLSHVSHELRSPLTAIYQFATILLDRLAGELNLEQHDYLEIVLRNVKQLQSMIDDLLEVTRVQAGKLTIELQCTSVSDAIAYTVDTLQGAATAKGITLSSDPSAYLPWAYADPTRLRQILIILFDNAVKFTSAGGVVKVQALEFEKDPGFLLVEVSDTGCGINPEITERIFEHLYQVTDPGEGGRRGLGLGLYISKELVSRQGGKIWVTSEPHKGSSFFFTIPIFSLASLIAPILTSDKKPGDAIALFVVEMDSQDGSLSPDVRKEMSNIARELLHRCLLPDLDVILPKMGSASEQEFFFVAACTNVRGAEVMSKRIREQFRLCEQLQQADLTFAVSYSFLSAISTDVNPSKDKIAEQVAEIEERINAISLSRSVLT